MFGFLRPKFKSESDAGLSLIFNLTLVIAIIAGGSRGQSLVERGDLSYDRFVQGSKYILIAALIAFLVMVYKSIWALRALWKGDYTNEPDNVICLNCRSPFIYDSVKSLKCPKCGGTLENLKGFFERHPDQRT
jgi:hypothetical protein